ncbi:MAG: hypothetical protein ACKO96_35040 [Flammeovirgaceae bacterium]
MAMSSYSHRIFKLLILSVFLFSAESIYSQSTFEASGSNSGGDWSDPTSWTKTINNNANTYPQAGDIAIIKFDGSVDVDASNAAAASLTIESSGSGGGLLRVRLSKTLNISGAITIQPGGSTIFQVNSGCTVNASSISVGGGTVNISGSLNLSTGSAVISGAGSLNISNTGSITLSNGIINVGSTSAGALVVNAGGSLSCTGLTVGAFSSGVTLSGSINLGGGTWTNGGFVSPVSGTVYNFSQLTVTNPITLLSGGVINGPFNGTTEGAINSSIDLSTESILSSGNGIIKIKGSLTIGSGKFTPGSSTIHTYGTSTISAANAIELNNVTVESGTLDLQGATVVVNGSVTNNGDLTISGTYQFINFSNSGNVTNNGSLIIEA